jgi:hypothetical protein
MMKKEMATTRPKADSPTGYLRPAKYAQIAKMTAATMLAGIMVHELASSQRQRELLSLDRNTRQQC